MRRNLHTKSRNNINLVPPTDQFVFVESVSAYFFSLLGIQGTISLIDGVFEVSFFSGISQWSSEVSQPQNMFWFFSKMPVGLALCWPVSPIQPSFNPAIPKWPGKVQVLQTYFRAKLKHVLKLGHLRASMRNTAKNIYKSSFNPY